MIDWRTPLGHHFFEIAVAHPVAAVPPHRPQDDVTGEMPTGEDAHGCDYFTPVFLLPQLCNSTGVTGIWKFTWLCHACLVWLEESDFTAKIPEKLTSQNRF
ncbi:hypothetical protein [Corynebacterium glutamicum]|uniref:hypothetical protein n=1 Tax=Corynebacterium glutamicum TaxID=1718 RepID=UPI000B355EB0|nr:hypothetical protein [Corynebacterium glutamicum]